MDLDPWLTALCIAAATIYVAARMRTFVRDARLSGESASGAGCANHGCESHGCGGRANAHVASEPTCGASPRKAQQR